MDERERYFWDLTGCLIVPGVLGPEELAAANAALDYCHAEGLVKHGEENSGARDSQRLRGSGHVRQTSSEGLFTLPKPHCEPFRRLLAHPAVVSRLNIMCGRGFRFDHGPHYIGGVRGTAGLTMHGAGEPHRGYVAYHQQNGNSYCVGVTVSWSLADAGPGDGGFACVVGSQIQVHPCLPASVPWMTTWVSSSSREMCCSSWMVPRPTAPCRGTPITTAAPCSTNTLAAPRPEAAGLRAWPLPRSTGGEELVEGMPPQERGVMYGPASAPGTRDVNLIVDDSGHVTVGEENA